MGIFNHVGICHWDSESISHKGIEIISFSNKKSIPSRNSESEI